METGSRPKKPMGGLTNYLVFGGPAVVLALLWLLFEVQGVVSVPLIGGISVELDPATGTHRAHVAPWLSYTFTILAYLSVALFGYVIKLRTENAELFHSLNALETANQDLQNQSGKNSRAYKELTGAVLAAGQIVNRLYSIDRPRWRFTRVVGSYLVDAEGNGTVEMLYHIEAGPEPAHVWRFDIIADNSADRVDWLDQISFKVESLDLLEGKDAKYLLFHDAPRTKKVAIFFLPEIVAGETRKIKITYKWPGLARDLISHGVTEFSHLFRTCDPLDCAEVEYKYLFARELGTLSFHRLKNASPTDAVTEISDSALGALGWRFYDPTLTMENRQLTFAVRRDQP